MPYMKRIIDTDIHPYINPKRIRDFLPALWRVRHASGNSGPGGPGYWNPNGVRRSDIKLPDGSAIGDDPASLSTYFFDKYAIEYGLLNVNFLSFALSPEPDYSAAIASAINDVLIEDWLPADKRFRASIMVSLSDPELAAQEIRRVGGYLGMVQVMLPDGASKPYGNRFYHPIYAAAAECGLPVAIHPGGQGVGISGPPTAVGYPSSYFEWHTSLVGSFIAHLVSLVTEGVFIKFPTLKFVLIEGGVSWLPALLWRLDKNWKGLRQTTPWITRLPSEIVHDHVLFTTQPLEEPEHGAFFHDILKMFPADRMLMFSSDFPHWDADTPEFASRALPPALRDRIFSETARELYNLPASTNV